MQRVKTKSATQTFPFKSARDTARPSRSVRWKSDTAPKSPSSREDVRGPRILRVNKMETAPTLRDQEDEPQEEARPRHGYSLFSRRRGRRG